MAPSRTSPVAAASHNRVPPVELPMQKTETGSITRRHALQERYAWTTHCVSSSASALWVPVLALVYCT
ncbi:hypothetical protein AURDEDRAFT_175495 [Auricularia subglabra TFB-10046 SS5]|uniref:Uncharacterized protein n=1 Tax=Auricularia subglabra (strain TFB-10046 / SS5) TaxID=717982 RepID=J0WT47_AURST|nr:hypothetical protein AURDEDRAFT_175495 [Auricularia subglabra TFB-10046 SS5]